MIKENKIYEKNTFENTSGDLLRIQAGKWRQPKE